MIFRIDSVIMNHPTSVAAATGFLEERGYVTEFTEAAQNSHPSTRPYFRSYSPLYDVAMNRAADCYSVETTVYSGGISKKSGGLSPVVPSVNAEEFKETGIEVVAGRRLHRGTYLPLGTEIFAERISKNSVFRFTEVIQRTRDVSASAGFWEKFAMEKENGGDDKCVRMIFPAMPAFSPVPLRLTLVKHQEAEPWRFDDSGFNGLAFSSQNSEEERENLSQTGLSPLPMESARFNGENLKLFFVIGPGGEIAEVVEVCR